jgi:hypothetical protein
MPNLTILQLILVALVLLALIAGVVFGATTGNLFIFIPCTCALVAGILGLFGLL